MTPAIHLRLSEEVRNKVEILAAREERTLADMLRRLIIRGIDHTGHAAPPPDAGMVDAAPFSRDLGAAEAFLASQGYTRAEDGTWGKAG